MTNYDAGLAKLALEINHLANSITNGLGTRANHPTYGITKARLNADLSRLQGLIEAVLYVTGEWDHAAGVLWHAETNAKVRETMGIDVANLRQRIADS